MTDDRGKSDLLGIKPIGQAINTAVSASVSGVSEFLSRICLPVAEEFGFLLKDRVNYWRTRNLVSTSQKTEELLRKFGRQDVQVHPRLVRMALENGSWSDDDHLQNMWAGLLASSCTADGKDDGNLVFMNLLSQLTSSQARILHFVCRKANKTVGASGFVIANPLDLSIEKLIEESGVGDLNRLHRELRHLVSLDLIEGSKPWYFASTINETYADVTPTELALHLYVRCEGSLDGPVDYFFRKSDYFDKGKL